MSKNEVLDADVVIVGAGPVGLMLAAELRLGGVQPLVLERLAIPDPDRKARGVGPLAAEALARRGLGERIAAHDIAGRADFRRDHGSDKKHFAWIHKIDPALQEEPHRQGALIWQPALVQLLTEFISELGVAVRRGHAVTALTQDNHAVTSTVLGPDGEYRIRTRYLVGCDGGRSTIRKLADFDFPGTAPIMVTRIARRADIADREKLPPPGRTSTGTLMYSDTVLATFDFDDISDRGEPMTLEELQASVRRVSGTDVTITAMQDARRFSDNARQVTSYREGRVLLAGDAAHVHSPNGGQGLNLGIMDAVNLGWKLAATTRGWAPEGLLDTYTAERHPAGATVLHNTRAQSALLRPGPHVDSLRDILSELMDIKAVNQYFGRMMSGLDTRYAFAAASSDGHPLIGYHCPDVALTIATSGGGTSKSSLFQFTRSGRGILLCSSADSAIDDLTAPLSDRLERVAVLSIDHDELAAALIRPDGVVAWAASPGQSLDIVGLRTAVLSWFGGA
ncbi:FAD-dependent monooxygenase [Pendulispora albinea]|uniref:FAD-dependent monooxygenase n=1 Tax=Pendulispora albinea TaxID=2741071 RepID=A0ABZ2M772_9BACT